MKASYKILMLKNNSTLYFNRHTNYYGINGVVSFIIYTAKNKYAVQPVLIDGGGTQNF